MKIEDFISAGGRIEVQTQFSNIYFHDGKLEKVMRIPTRYIFSKDPEEVSILHYYLHTMYHMHMLGHKSKEEIAAENAVQKAEEALKAAKSVLEKVKESK